jgi:DNA-binding NtrC family response regulator
MQLTPNDNTAIRILIVDDETDISEMLERHLKFSGYNVFTAPSGEQALTILSNTMIDILISDIVMPGMGGVELLEEVQKQYPMIRVIMITGYITLDNALACMRKKADILIFKPFDDMAEIDDAIKNAIRTLQDWKLKLQKLGHYNIQRR